MGIHTRDLAAGDASDLAALMARIEVDHPTGFCLGATEITEIMRDKHDAVFDGAFDGETLVAFTTLMPGAPQHGQQRFFLFGDVDPQRLREGLGTLMLTRQLERGRAIHAATAPDVAAAYSGSALAGRADQAGLFVSAGFEAGRHSFLMVADLTTVPAPVPLPEDVTVEPFDPSRAEEVRLAHNTAFADNPDSSPVGAEFWAMFVVRSVHNRHHLSAVARDRSGAVVGYVLAHEYAVAPSGGPGPELHVPYVGTVPEHRGRGLATALLGHVLRLGHEAGYTTASLNVDTHNPTGALGIYERAGFVQVYRQDFYTLTEPPG